MIKRSNMYILDNKRMYRKRNIKVPKEHRPLKNESYCLIQGEGNKIIIDHKGYCYAEKNTKIKTDRYIYDYERINIFRLNTLSH